ncbi:pregnancy zone protein-like [Choristoneura fumiferana]|uniref:pregnancy zone protein-like n=1 Tax=Choristoneura fumiferana TaxID=7141 RepID=UPI003D15CA6B
MWILIALVFLVPVDSLLSDYIAQNYTSTNPCTDQNHLFLLPGALTAGSSSRACVSRFAPDGPALVLLTLSAAGHETTATRELPPGDGGCLDLPVPLLPNTKAEVTVSIRYPLAQCTWVRRVIVRIASGRLIVLHTERGRYRPGETLRVRALVLRADLAPVHGSIDEIWLEGPRGAWEGTRAASWARVRTRLGIGQVQHELDAQAPPGRWTVRARLADGSQGASEFWVGNYEIPPFQLSVRHAARVLRTSERLVWTVCVRYPWTEAVEGMLVIRLRGAGGNFDTDETPGVRTAVRLRTPKACHRHAVAARRIGLDGATPPDVVVADFSFQEEGTRIWQNTTVVSQVVDKPITLEFLAKHRAVIAPGLPYKLKIKATRWDDKPAANERVRVCRAGACDEAVTDARGVARVMFTAEEDSDAIYKFQATLKNDSSTVSVPLYLPVRHTGALHAALGPLKGDTNAARSFVPLYLSSKDVDTALTVHFVVITRGGIIYRWGATTQCPVSSSTNKIYTAARNSRCSQTNLAYSTYQLAEGNTSDALLDRHLLRVMLPIKVTHQMCPDSHLITYFYYKGELVSASKYIEMEECFANKVEASWLSRQVAPGASASLSLTTHGLSLCALTAVDVAARGATPAPSIKDAVVQRLRRLIDAHRNLTEYDAAGECFLTTDTTDIPSSSMELTTRWLAAAGVRAAGGAPTSRRCVEAPSPLVANDATPPRSDFSEAWLWRLVAVGANGSAVAAARAPDAITRYEATALCVARNGITVSQPAVLQVFREFFIHADGPKRLRRGDSAIIQYRIFNYLYEPLSIQIQVLTDPHLEVSSEAVHAVCVGSRASVAWRVALHAALPGAARLALRASSVRDGACGGTASGLSDEVIIQIQVDPEGVPAQDHHSALLCGRGSPESRTSEISWSWPEVEAVPGTEAVTVWAVGDIVGPLLADADSLVLLPRGCGEQNMARLATNLLALRQLDPASAAAASAKEHVARGFTRQLQYVHSSGGFSAFGSTDDPSTWLTAFAVRYLRKAHEVLSPGLPTPPALERAERWLLSQQMENGCFRNEGQVFHRELKGGLNEDGEIANVALTAYVITSLVESTPNLPYTVVRNTLSCLRALPPLKTKTPTRVYAHAVLAYAFMRLRKYEDELRKTNEASPWENEALENDEDVRELVQLMRIARRQEEFVWWETNSLATSVEATGYALLALAACAPALSASCAHDARGAARWLAAHRGPGGGFVATQDTLVALEALTAWSAAQPPTPAHLNVTVRAGGTVASAVLTPDIKVPEVMKTGLGKLDVAVEGSGCALVQATRSYHTLAPSDQGSRLSVQVSVRTDGPFDCAADGSGCFCAAVVEACVLWSGEFPEMALLDIALPGGFGADAALLYALLREPDTLVRRIEVSANAGRATLYLAARGAAGGLRRCFPVHAVGPAAATRPAHARLADYYAPANNDTQMYTIPEDCPSKISHRSNDYLRSENLFNKAISEDSGEIIITDEFSFEDVPEGIPLEDPIYDNLTQPEEKLNETEIQSRVAGNLQEAPNVDNSDSDTQVDSEKATSKLESENEIIRIDDKIERNFEKDEYKSNMQTTVVPVIIHTEKELESTPANNLNTEFDESVKLKSLDTNEHKIEIRDDTKQEEQAAGVENPQLSHFHVIDSEKDLDVPSGIEGPVPAVVLPPPNFVPIRSNTAVFDAAAFPSIQANPKALYSYPPYSYYVYTELPRFRYAYNKR